jgi:hypothetical protein
MAARGYVARSGTSATNVTPVALAAGVAKTVVAMLGASSDTLNVDEIGISFDGVAPAAVPAIVELLEISALGTVTSFTPVQLYGPTQPSSASAGYNASAEPTVVASRVPWYVPVFNGLFVVQYPLGKEPVVAASRGFGLRVTAPAIVNCLPYINFSE